MQKTNNVKQLLADSFKKLVLTKPIEKITIKEITDGAGVIRVTFYNHFQDKYELLEWICQEEIVAPTRMLLFSGMQKEAMTFLFTSIRHNKSFYIHAAMLEGQNSFESIVRGCFADVIVDYLAGQEEKEKIYNWLSPEWISQFYAQGLAYMLISWIKTGMEESPENMVELYSFVTSHSMIDLPHAL